MQKISLSVELVNTVLAYLGNRPYVETASLIKAIHDEAAGQILEEKEEVLPETC